ncbi:helix-turn-helix domain-containing protein [Sodalis sp. C49]|uniref:helix-turn-helix domain-containing protein n=1 Tax=Sodalis sp. C49 TaxID=3228929 RepID=UPI003965BA24
MEKNDLNLGVIMYHENILDDLLIWIESNLEAPLNVGILSAKSGYSKWYLQRLFKKLTGYSLAAYTRKRRLTRAAEELRQSAITIKDIAHKYQFDDHSALTRAFKKNFHITPSAYRRLPVRTDDGLQPVLTLKNSPRPGPGYRL